MFKLIYDARSALKCRSQYRLISRLLIFILILGGSIGCRSNIDPETPDKKRPHEPDDLLRQAAHIGERDPRKPQREFRFFQSLMGTQFNIQLVGYDQLTAQAAARAAFNEVRRVEHLVSSWRENSDIGRLNRFAGERSVNLSVETAWLLCHSRSISTLTRGAFDITWAALKGLWDFRHNRMPDHDILQRRLRSVGIQHLKISREAISDTEILQTSIEPSKEMKNRSKLEPEFKSTLRVRESPPQDLCQDLIAKPLPPAWSKFKPDPPSEWAQKWSGQLMMKSAQVDLGGIAKGFGVDQAARVLRRLGYQDFLIDGGGDLLASGRSLGGDPWSIGIAHPRTNATWGRLWIPSDWSVVTSGDYERYFIDDQVRYHHIIDLRTGYPARGSVAVTVIAKSAMLADAYATGLFVLGPREGLALAESIPDLEAIFLTPIGEVITTEGAQVFSHDLKPRWRE